MKRGAGEKTKEACAKIRSLDPVSHITGLALFSLPLCR